jgi:hypothetical protein
MNDLASHLENDVDWSRFFGAVDRLFLDEGLKSNSDNMFRSRTIEKALEKYSDFLHVDQIGYDFTYKSMKVELKTKKQLFQKDNQYRTGVIKMKNFHGNKTAEDYKTTKTFDYLVAIDLISRRVIIVEDEKARSLYKNYGDGAIIQLNYGDYYECNLPAFLIPKMPTQMLSEERDKLIDSFLES